LAHALTVAKPPYFGKAALAGLALGFVHADCVEDLKILFVMVISVPLALLGTFALFIVLAFAYGLLTALLRLEPLSESVTGTGATVMFFGFLYVIYELLTRALMARAVPQSATAFASPRPSPPIGRTVLKAMASSQRFGPAFFSCYGCPWPQSTSIRLISAPRRLRPSPITARTTWIDSAVRERACKRR
jgi:hypothetical protein